MQQSIVRDPVNASGPDTLDVITRVVTAPSPEQAHEDEDGLPDPVKSMTKTSRIAITLLVILGNSIQVRHIMPVSVVPQYSLS